MGTLEHYDVIIRQVDRLVEYLKSIQVEAELSSHLESDYLAAHEFYEGYKKSPYGNSCPNGRIALGGLHELYKWIWAVKNSNEFDKLKPHLGLLVQAAPRFNSAVPMLNPVTGKQDDKTNKFIEAIVGFFAVAHGMDVDLDDPVSSSGGENPDAIFTFQGTRVSVACKTLRSTKPATILQNIESGAKQISRCGCDHGYILLNGMNILEHDKVQDQIFTTVAEPLWVLKSGLEEIYQSVLVDCKSELDEMFKLNPKVSPIVITVIHSVTRLHSSIGVLSTSLKGTTVTNFRGEEVYDEHEIKLPQAFNEFIHNREPGA